MENEKQSALDTALPSKTGRSSRRSKIQPQAERDKDQENIDSSAYVAGQQLEQVKCIVAKGDENKQATTPVSVSISTNSSTNSTPRRRKDPLANLHSNLSPKYIGYMTPNSSTADNGIEERKRSTRRRHHKIGTNDDDVSMSRDSSLDITDSVQLCTGTLEAATSLGYVRRTGMSGRDSNSSTPEHMNIRRKEFVSPIDKLLKKNGSIVDNVHELPLYDDKNDEILNEMFTKSKSQNEEESNDLFEQNNNEINSRVKHIQQQIKCELKESQAKDIETVNKIEDLEFDRETHSSDEDQNEEETTSKKVTKNNTTEKETKADEMKKCVEEPTENEIENGTLISNSPESDNEIKNNFEDNVNVTKGSSDQLVNVGSPSSKESLNHEYSNAKTPEFMDKNNYAPTDNTGSKQVSIIVENHILDGEIQADHEETESNTDFTVEHSSVKSPSAVSTDSAKGSSILNEGSWVTYTVGDLFWGQIYNYCYWPCMVCPDPDGKTISTKETVGDQHVMVHVRFFADNGRRNWVKRENLIPYTTLQSYQDRIDECREKHGAKSAKYKQLVPKKTKVPIWHEAVSEMDIVAKSSHENRLETFFEIFEKSKAFQKKEKQRRKSLYLPIGRHISNSDAESFYGSTENMNNLNNAQENLKRERSVSPFSPAFSPIKSTTLKKRKISEENPESQTSLNSEANDAELRRRQSQSSGISSALNGLDIFQGMEFESFYAVMRDFVLEKNQNEILEKSLFVAVRNIWALKQVNREQMDYKLRMAVVKSEEKEDASINIEGPPSDFKRLSNRLKTLEARKSLTHQQLTSAYVDLSGESSAVVAATKGTKETHMNGAEKTKRPLIINRPILEVIDDIFELDNKYLFKGMTRDPVCKYCFKPGGNLKRCAKNCNNFLHSECLNIDFKIKEIKGRRGQKRLNGIKAYTDIPMEVSSTTSSIVDLTLSDSGISDLPSATSVLHVTSDTVVTDEEIICRECTSNESPKCMVCNLAESSKPEDPLIKCNMAHCDRSFHPACCKYWPQSKITISKNHIQAFRCPCHVCHTCVSDDPKGKFQHLSTNKITKCVKCPATYHTDSTCIPAGSQILTAAYLICPRHTSSKQDMTVNVNWCFICVGGGQVVCCETCPTAVHAQCLKIPIDPNEGYICEECESGRMPLYGEMVWAKFNHFRWWPAIILPPTEIPKNIAKKNHNPSDFVVRFFGTHDHGWISRRRVYLYLEGDSSEPPKTKSFLDMNYLRGVEEAKEVYEIVKTKKIKQRNSNEEKEKLHPQPYVRIRANRPVPPVKLHVDMERVNKCECNPNDINPCGPDTNCLNRVLYHECNPKVCPAGERCQNQMFESRISPRLDVVYMRERGFGLVSREPIAAGTFIIEYVGEIINDNEFRSRMSQKSLDRDENFYFLSVEKDYIIDAGPKGNLARFMNHSCDPNCETQKWSVNSLNRIGLFAIKDIPADTELTFNYHWDDLLGNEKKTCFCGSKKCAGQIGGKIKDDSKEPLPFSDISVKSKSKTKSKLKPLKRLKTMQSKKAKGKGKGLSKMRLNIVNHKSSKMIAAASLAESAALSRSRSISPQATSSKISGDGETSTKTSRSQTPENVIC